MSMKAAGILLAVVIMLSHSRDLLTQNTYGVKRIESPAEQLDLEHIRDYQIYLVNEKKVSWSSFIQLLCFFRQSTS